MLFKSPNHQFFIFLSLLMALMCPFLGYAFEKQHIDNSTQTLPQETPSQKDNEYLWVNSVHQSLSDSVYQSAKWFDEFFLEEGGDISNPQTLARIRLGWEPRSRDLKAFDTRFRLKIRLPNLENKVDLIFSDDENDDEKELPLDGAGTQSDSHNQHFTAAIRLISKDTKRSQISSRVGISGGDLFARARYKKKYAWLERHSFSITPSVYYYLDDGLGEKLLLEYSYQLNPKEQLRVDYSIRGSQSFSGIRWRHGFYKLSQISETSASILGFKVEGERNGDNGFFIDKYTLNYRYRFNALRKWIYFEIEPFMEWEEDEHYTTTPGIAFRIEGHFQKNNK